NQLLGGAGGDCFGAPHERLERLGVLLGVLLDQGPSQVCLGCEVMKEGTLGGTRLGQDRVHRGGTEAAGQHQSTGRIQNPLSGRHGEHSISLPDRLVGLYARPTSWSGTADRPTKDSSNDTRPHPPCCRNRSFPRDRRSAPTPVEDGGPRSPGRGGPAWDHGSRP